MVEKAVALYDSTRLHTVKRLNLALRGWIYRWAYLPKLKAFDVFDGAHEALEIGAGYGTKLSHTVSRVPQTSFRGIEQSSVMVEKGEAWYPAVKDCMEVGDATNLLSVKSNSQDVLMYYQVLHHLDWGQLEQAMQEAQRVLKNGGKVVVIDTFLDDANDGFSALRRVIFSTIEPVYGLVSQPSSGNYKNQPEKAFINFMRAQGFPLKNQSAPFGKLSVSEILVFQKKGSRNVVSLKS